MDRDVPLTVLSKNEWNIIVNTDMNPSDVTRYFYENMKVRTFGELLACDSNYKNVKELLVDKLCEYDETAKRDSVRKKVGNWLSGQNQPADREELMKICFALELDEAKARKFMSFSFDGGFHLRNPREVAFLYCIRTGRTYPEALHFISGLKPLENPAKEQSVPAPTAGSAHRSAQGNDTMCFSHDIIYTKVVADAFANLYDDDAFYKFYADNYVNFGHLHNTAYVYFMRFFNELISPSAPIHAQKDDAYPIEKAVDTYLRMNLPMDKKTAGYSAVQKAIRSFWPNATIIKNMRNREEDVNRKVLLLLYVVTEGIGGADIDDEILFEELTPYEMLEEHTWRINLMLHECGMGLLDPRNPFDWLILYSLKTNEDDKSMSDRLQEVLDVLFIDTD